MPARRSLQQSIGNEGELIFLRSPIYNLINLPISDGQRMLVVLLLEIHGIYGYGELHEYSKTVHRFDPIPSFQIFFVLRKKNSHISTLHVIHHGVMPMSVWFGVKFLPGGSSTFFGFLNTFVHIIMYSYYFFAALGPQYQKYLWWKKYLTALQMVRNT